MFVHGHSVPLETSEQSNGAQIISVYNVFGPLLDLKAITFVSVSFIYNSYNNKVKIIYFHNLDSF